MSEVIAADNPRAVVGGNNPPEPTPFEMSQKEIEDLFLEASNWCDGAQITDQGQADQVAKLVEMLGEAIKAAEARRVAEKKPHDDAAKAVQAKYKPILDRAELARSTAKKVLAPWLQHIRDMQEEEARRTREEAEALEREAREKLRASQPTDLEARMEAERVARAAKEAARDASRLEKAKAHAKGGGRALGLRKRAVVVMTDAKAALRYYMLQRPDRLKTLLQQLAEEDARSGKRDLPGFEITEEDIVQ